MSEGTIKQDKSIHDWLSAGQALYAAALDELGALGAAADELEQRICEKRGQVNQIARIIGKPLIEWDGAGARVAKRMENPSADQTLRMLAGAKCGTYSG